MSTISPFPGIRFNPEKVRDLAEVISPPYDKISPAERKVLWDKNEYNVVRLILPPPSEQETDVATQSVSGESDAWYQQAAERFQQWQQEGILKTDPNWLYVYRQTFSYQQVQWTRIGLFVALQLNDQGGPHAHEHTFEGPKADRLRLLKAMKANPSPIFLLADGEKDLWDSVFTQADTLLTEFKSPGEEEHELFAITDPKAIQLVREFVHRRTLVIADGHHRYETALNYCREMKEATGEDPEKQPWGSVLSIIVPSCSPGLLVLPGHRVLIDLPDGWINTLRQSVQDTCKVETIDNLEGDTIRAMFENPDYQNSILTTDGEHSCMITLTSPDAVTALQKIDAPLRRLNVSILHQYILEDCLNLDKETQQKSIRYIRGEDEAITMLKQGEAKGAFLMAGIPPETVFNVSQQNVRMPQKSTDFYPKIPTGLVMRSVESIKILEK